MAKKKDEAVKDLAKETKKLRKQNERLAETLQGLRDDQAEAYRGIRDLLEGRLPARDPVEPVEEDPASTDGSLEGAEITGTVEGAREADAAEPESAHTPDADTGEVPEATEAAVRRAEELGVDLSAVKGTGSGGRILVKDVEAAANGGR